MASTLDTVIKISLSGIDKVFTQLKQVIAQTKDLKADFQTIGQAAQSTFTKATAAIGGMLFAADPIRFEMFKTKLLVLSAVIGQAFIPLLKDVIGWLDKTINYFKSLTAEQRQQILFWTKLTLGMLGLVVGIGLLVSTLGKLVSVLKAVKAVSVFFGGWAGVILLVAAALGFVSTQAEGSLGNLLPLADTFKGIWEAILPILQTVGKVLLWLVNSPLLKVAVWVAIGFAVRGLALSLWGVVASLTAMIVELGVAIKEWATLGSTATVAGTKMKGATLAGSLKGTALATLGIAALDTATDKPNREDNRLQRNLKRAYGGLKVAVGAEDSDYVHKSEEEFSKKGKVDGAGTGLGAYAFGAAIKTLLGKEKLTLENFGKNFKGILSAKKDDDRGLGIQQKPQFSQLQDFYKKIQEGAFFDPKQELDKERIRIAQSSDEKLGTLVQQGQKPSGATFGF